MMRGLTRMLCLLFLGGFVITPQARAQETIVRHERSSDILARQYLASRAYSDAGRFMTTKVGSVVMSSEALNAVVQQYCVRCHNDAMRRGNLSLSDFDVGAAVQSAETAEKMIIKLRAGMMPLPGARRPSSDTLLALVETLETLIDEAAEDQMNPGMRPFSD